MGVVKSGKLVTGVVGRLEGSLWRVFVIYNDAISSDLSVAYAWVSVESNISNNFDKL